MLKRNRIVFFLRASFAIVGIALFYFWLSLLFSLYVSTVARIFVTLFWGGIFGLIGCHFLRKELSLSITFWQSLAIILLNCVSGLAILGLIFYYPELFKYLLFDGLSIPFALFSLLVISVMFYYGQRIVFQKRLLELHCFLNEHLWGIVLAGIFFVSYFVLAFAFNRTEIYIVDSLFEGDHSYWLRFFSITKNSPSLIVRPVHPLIYVFLRPLSWFAALFLNGNTYYATLFVIAANGAIAVFLFWFFLYRHGLSLLFSLLMASVFGVSTTHLLFGSFAETYIFSAAAILLFFVILQFKDSSLKKLVPAGVLVFGITISNIIQTIIALFFVRRKASIVLRYVIFVFFLGVLLSVLNNAVFPHEAGYFFVPENLLREQKYAQSVLDFPAWKLHGRIYATARSLFLYTVVAPSSFFITPDPGKPLPRISFFSFSPGTYSHSAYGGFGNIVLLLWLLLLAFAGIHFLWQLRKRENWKKSTTLFSFALLANVAFNLLFHIVYGEDPFLYSANWAYALLLFIAINLIERWWSKIYLLLFLGLLMANNFFFLDDLLAVLAQAF